MDISRIKSKKLELDCEIKFHLAKENFGEFYQILLENANFLYEMNQLPKKSKNEFLHKYFSHCKKVFNKVLIYEINSLRISNKLSGDSTYKRYRSFINHLTHPTVHFDIYDKYHTAFNLILDYLNNLIESYRRVITSLENNKILIKKGFLKESIQNIKIIGDQHEHGQGVTVIQFNNRNSLIFKPKDLKADKNFQNLLKWFNENFEILKFQTLTIIEDNNCGWVQFIEPKKCATEKELENFFERQGYYLALFNLLNTTDMHNENIIAYGEYPIYVDLETIFHNQSFYSYSSNANEKARSVISNSILSTNMLPVSITNMRFQSFNFSSLNHSEGSVHTYEIENSFTDVIKMKRVQREISYHNSHLPTFMGETIDGENYIFQIVKGFEKFCQEIIRHRKKLLSSNSPLIEFEGIQIRQVLRPTYFYGRLIDGSYHPNHLLSDERHKKYLKKLINLDNYNFDLDVLNEEIEFMRQDSVPYFYSYSDSTDLYIGKIKINNFFKETSYNIVKNNINSLNKAQIVENIKLIIGSIDSHSKIPFLKNKNRMLLEATIIGDIILDNSIYSNDENSVTWNTFKFNNFGTLNYETMGIDLYSGLTGMLLFYGHLYLNTKDDKYLKISHQIMNTIIQEIENEQICNVSLFNGLSGIIYVTSTLPFILNNPKYRNFITKVINIIDENYKKDTQFDLIGGISGSLIALIKYYRVTNETHLLNKIDKYYQFLIDNTAINDDQYITWNSQTFGTVQKDIMGIAHGNSGIVISLLHYYQLRKIETVKTIIKKVVNYETLLSSKLINNIEKINSSSFNWCNGFYGVYTSLNNVSNTLNIPNNLNEKYVSALISSKHYQNEVCLCHGVSGRYLLENQNKLISNDFFDFLLSKIYRSDTWWENTSGKYNHRIGFMNGETGTGYFLLRLVNDKTPDILLFKN